jgi:hypothetical protein
LVPKKKEEKKKDHLQKQFDLQNKLLLIQKQFDPQKEKKRKTSSPIKI